MFCVDPGDLVILGYTEELHGLPDITNQLSDLLADARIMQLQQVAATACIVHACTVA